MYPFVHLHVHSQYSLLDGQASIQRLIDKAVGDGMKALALTDHGVMYGIKEFLNYAGKKNAPVNAEIKKIKKEISDLERSGAGGTGRPGDKETGGLGNLEAGGPGDEGTEGKVAQLRQKLAETESKLFKPIVGCECYLARRGRHLQSEKIDGSGWHLVVLAKNLQGYKNLIKMVSKS